jgi:hypothetical protein
MSSRRTGTNDPDWGFDWPPKKKIVPSEIIELDKLPVDTKSSRSDNPLLQFNNDRLPLLMPLPVRLPQRTRVEPSEAEVEEEAEDEVEDEVEDEEVEAEGQGERARAAAPDIDELPEAVQKELRGLDTEFWGPIALEGYLNLKRGWIMPAALLILTLVAIVEGMILLWGKWEPSSAVRQSQSGTLSNEEARAQPSVQEGLGKPIPPIATPRANTSALDGNRLARSLESAAPRAVPDAKQKVRPEPARNPPVASAPRTQAPIQTHGWIAISSPVEMDVFENGRLIGTSRGPRITLRAGAHTLEFENSTVGHREQQQVQVTSGKETALTVSLPTGILNVNATPWADVWIDGKPIGQTPIGNLRIAIGPHDVLFRHPDLGEKTVSTVVKGSATTRVSADLTQR